jgi:hypothetical protein
VLWGFVDARTYNASRARSPCSPGWGCGALVLDLWGDVETADSGQVVWWRLREGGGSVAVDSGFLASWGPPGGWNGTVQPGATWYGGVGDGGRGGGRAQLSVDSMVRH